MAFIVELNKIIGCVDSISISLRNVMIIFHWCDP